MSGVILGDFSVGSVLQLRYGEVVIKRAVPLALALLSPSNPRLQILDTLSKFSHDSDQEVSANAILAMGIVGAGKVKVIHCCIRYLATVCCH